MQTDQRYPMQVVVQNGAPSPIFASPVGTSPLTFSTHLRLQPTRILSSLLIASSSVMVVGQILEIIAAALYVESSSRQSSPNLYGKICLDYYDNNQKECSSAQYAGFWGGLLVTISAAIVIILLSIPTNFRVCCALIWMVVALTFTTAVWGEAAHAIQINRPDLSEINDNRYNSEWPRHRQVALAGWLLMLIGGLAGMLLSVVVIILIVYAILKGQGILN